MQIENENKIRVDPCSSAAEIGFFSILVVRALDRPVNAGPSRGVFSSDPSQRRGMIDATYTTEYDARPGRSGIGGSTMGRRILFDPGESGFEPRSTQTQRGPHHQNGWLP